MGVLILMIFRTNCLRGDQWTFRHPKRFMSKFRVRSILNIPGYYHRIDFYRFTFQRKIKRF